VPPDLVSRLVVDPAPYWTWALVSRRRENRPAVRATIEVLTRTIGPLGLEADGVWLAAGDPFRAQPTG
jgi:hypothetical protein